MKQPPSTLPTSLEADGITPDGPNWTRWPGGWPNEINTALIDAVFSARAVYETGGGKGVLPLVRTWRDRHPTQRDSLVGLRDAIRSAGPETWATGFGSKQHSPGRACRRPDAPWKSATVLEAAETLIDVSIISAADITPDNRRLVEATLRTVPGIGPATATYYLMLLGHQGVKVDVMIRRYVKRAVGSPAQAAELVCAAAEGLGTTSLDLEHSIWAYERRR